MQPDSLKKIGLYLIYLGMSVLIGYILALFTLPNFAGWWDNYIGTTGFTVSAITIAIGAILASYGVKKMQPAIGAAPNQSLLKTFITAGLLIILVIWGSLFFLDIAFPH